MPERGDRWAPVRAAGILAAVLLTGWARADAAAGKQAALEPRVRRIVDQYAAPLINPANGKPSPKQAPGGIVGVYIREKTFYFPYGRIDEAGHPPTKDTLFGVGSVTKVFTTSVLGQRPELFNQSITSGPLPPGYHLQPEEAPVTFGQLATFTGGVPRVPSNCGDNPVCDQPLFVAFINGVKPGGGRLPAPNLYSNAGIGLLAQALMYRDGYKRFDGRDTTQWLSDHLFSSLGMQHTSYPSNADRAHPLARAYDLQGGSYVRIVYAPWVPWGAAGRLFSTAEDMVRFIMANVGVKRIDGKEIPEKVLGGMRQALLPRAEMTQADSSRRQGFAWVVWPEDPQTGSRLRGKDGGLDGVSAYVAVNPELHYGVIVLLNKSGVDAPRAIDIMKALQPLARQAS
ncbi:MAG: serine hydrolase [Acidobacteriota bacterium]|nr:serine hydrolase [Acidobacteriota bacterium]